MLHLKRNRESINKQKIYFSLLFFSFFISFITHIFNLDKTKFFDLLLTLYSLSMITVAAKIGLYLYRKVHLVLRFAFLGLSYYLIYNSEKFTKPDNIITNFINDILNLIVFTAILLIIIVVIGFIKKFIKLFKAITNKKGKFILLSKLSALIFIIGSCIYTIQSIKSINKRLDVIEMRFGGSSKGKHECEKCRKQELFHGVSPLRGKRSRTSKKSVPCR